MCVRCFRYVPLGERCEGCGEFVVDFSESGTENATFRQCERHGVWLVSEQSCESCEKEHSTIPAPPSWLYQSPSLYGRAFLHWAQFGRRPYEEILDAAPAISENVARIDRRDREGTIGVTSQRVVFISMKSGTMYHDVDLSQVLRISFDGRRNVFLTLQTMQGKESLMLGRDQASRI